MARFYGIVSADSVVSAANGRTPVSADSIALFLGSGLATDTATADSLPLPTALAGITVQVQGSAGVTRPAPLFYVSSTQSNFKIPSVPPQVHASFTVMSSCNSRPITPIRPH